MINKRVVIEINNSTFNVKGFKNRVKDIIHIFELNIVVKLNSSELKNEINNTGPCLIKEINMKT